MVSADRGARETAAPRWARGLSGLIHRRWAAIVVAFAVLVGLAGAAASRLRIDQELRRLLPSSFPSVVRLDRLSARAGQQSDLYVTIRSPSRPANIAFGESVARALGERDDVRSVVFRRDLSFFDEHALLYASLADLVDLRRRVIARIRAEVRVRAYGDFSLRDGGELAPQDESLDFDPDTVRERYGVDEAHREFMEADEGRLMVVKVRPSHPATDLEPARRLLDQVNETVASLRPATFHPDLQVTLDGAYVQHEQRLNSIRQEVWGGSLAAGAALLLTLALYFRSVRAVALVMLPLLGATVGALAFGWWMFGVLNVVSAFIAAVLLGLGIDFGIHVLARLRQEHAAGASSERALAICLATTGKTTAAGGLSTALAFAVLSVADFQGFAQFGQIAAVGVLLALGGALVVMPALWVGSDRWRRWPPARTHRRAAGEPPVRRWRWTPLVLVIGALAIAGWGAANLDGLEYEHDLSRLGRRREAASGPKRAGYRDAVGTYRTVDPAVVLVDSVDDARAVQRQLEALLAMTPQEVDEFEPAHPPSRPLPQPPPSLEDALGDSELDADPQGDWTEIDADLEDPQFVALEAQARDEALMSPAVAQALGRYDPARRRAMRDRLAQVWSVHAFVPRLQAEKLRVIADIRARIDAKRFGLSESTRSQIDEWSRYLNVAEPVSVANLPRWVRAQFEDTTGDPTKFVVVATRGSKADIRNSRRIYAAFSSLQAPSGEVELAADFFVIPEIFDAIERDGPRVLGLALLVMLVTALVLLRHLGGVLAVSLAVSLSLLWLATLFWGLGWKLNFFNIIVVPLLLGMSQDDALHIVERHREEVVRNGVGNPRRVLREAGGAVFVTTLTTVFGFAGIALANHRGLNSMAWTAIAGMSLALIASVVVLPAVLELASRWRGKQP